MSGLIYASGAQSARAKGEQNLRIAVDWLARFGFTTPAILCLRLGIGTDSQGRIAERLVKGAWAKLVDCPSMVDGYIQKQRKQLPDGTYTIGASAPKLLVPTGKARMQFLQDNLVDAPKPLGTVSGERIFHDLTIQRACVMLIQKMESDRNAQCTPWQGYGYFQANNLKLPSKSYDAAIEVELLDDTQRNFIYGIEIELSKKHKDHGLHEAFSKIGYDLRNTRIHRCVWIFADKGLGDWYKKQFIAWINDRRDDELGIDKDASKDKVLFVHLDLFSKRFK